MTCPDWLRKAYRKAVNYTCQNCRKKEKEAGTLTIHRIIRGHKGGKYVPNNVMVICQECHRKIHGGEFNKK